LHRHLNQSEGLPIKHSFLLVVCNAVSTSEKDASNMAQDYRVSARFPITKHWLHPYLNGDAPLERSCIKNIRINHTNPFAASRRCPPASFRMPIPVRKVLSAKVAFGWETAERRCGCVASPSGAFVRSPGKHWGHLLSRRLSRLLTPAFPRVLFPLGTEYSSYATKAENGAGRGVGTSTREDKCPSSAGSSWV
jgi:hypothetical protein